MIAITSDGTLEGTVVDGTDLPVTGLSYRIDGGKILHLSIILGAAAPETQPERSARRRPEPKPAGEETT